MTYGIHSFGSSGGLAGHATPRATPTSIAASRVWTFGSRSRSRSNVRSRRAYGSSRWQPIREGGTSSMVEETILNGLLVVSMVLAGLLILIAAATLGRKVSDLEYQYAADINGIRRPTCRDGTARRSPRR